MLRGINAQIRLFHRSISPQVDMVELLKSSIDSVVKNKEVKVKPKESKKVEVKPVKEKTLDTDYLNKKYRREFNEPLNPGLIAEINGFFNKTEVRLEWTSFKFIEIPGEKERITLENDLREGRVETDNAPKNGSKKSKSIGLPEILFIGKANVGKSTLLNSLLTESQLKQNREFAFASKTAGFTPSMNCFNVGKRFKLIDTPGYGVRGTVKQGAQVLEYLRLRRELRRVYLLISAAEGFDDNDRSMLQLFTEQGVPFEIVFTKCDRLKSIKVIDKYLKDEDILSLPSDPTLIFTNSEINKKFPARRGISDLRASIFQACNLEPGTHPLKLIKKK